jgi:RNA ligase (TIGR02306 family)
MSEHKKQTRYDTNGVIPDRTMARIVTIDLIEPIVGATAIELAHVMGWQCVVKKDEFKVNEMCIYVCIDSILDPSNVNFSFLEGRQLKTKMILNTLSQGLVGPLKWITDIEKDFDLKTLKVDDDVTNLLKIKKYVESTELTEYVDNNKSGKPSIRFPSFVPKTDEERIQNLKNVFTNILGKNIVITRKEDGTSTTFIYFSKNNKSNKNDKNESIEKVYMMCGRNWQINDPISGSNKHYFEIQKKFDIKNKMQTLDKNIAIQGEIVGPKIGGNKLKLSELDYRVFNIYDIDNRYYLPWDQVVEITNILGLNRVPLIYKGICDEKFGDTASLMKLAESLEYVPDQSAEGIVVKTDYGVDHPRISFKVISNKFLLKNK